MQSGGGINLVDPLKYPTVLNFNKNTGFFKKTKWSINKILLVGFVVFTVFFLYNCRYGIFRYDKNILAPLAYASTV